MSWLDQTAQIGQDTRKNSARFGLCDADAVALLERWACVTRFPFIASANPILGNYPADWRWCRAFSLARCWRCTVYALSRVGSEAMVGLMVALSLVCEPPVVVAILSPDGRESPITAEIGLMKSGEQLSAMEMMGGIRWNGVHALRFWAGGLSFRCW